MIKCPKCGFEQPEDVFCASCGVNIKTYSDTHTRPKLRIVLVGLAALGLIFVIYEKLSQTVDSVATTSQKTHSLFDELNSELDKSDQSESPTTVGSAITNRSKTTPHATKAASPTEPTNSPTPVATATTTPSATAPPQPTLTPSPTPSASKISNQITIQFALAPKETMDKLGLTIGTPSSVLYSAKTDLNFQSMSVETHSFDQNQIAHFSQLVQDPKSRDYVGIQIDIMMTHATETAGDYKINIKRALPITSPTGEIKALGQDFSESVGIQAGQGFVIAGLIPRKPVTAAEMSLVSSSILRVLLDPGFQKYEQEFLVLINP